MSGIVYELIILAQLMRRPAHGYLIAKIINDIIGPYARISNGRLYPLLNQLQKAGLIASETVLPEHTPKERPIHSYTITEAGKQRLHELMLDTVSNLGEYQKLFALKACYLDLLPVEERLHIIDHYISYCQSNIKHLNTEAAGIIENASGWDWGTNWENIQSTIVNVLQHSAATWQLEQTWAQSLYDREVNNMQ
jgi:DNA-binding PadR family transcriptional regulator